MVLTHQNRGKKSEGFCGGFLRHWKPCFQHPFCHAALRSSLCIVAVETPTCLAFARMDLFSLRRATICAVIFASNFLTTQLRSIGTGASAQHGCVKHLSIPLFHHPNHFHHHTQAILHRNHTICHPYQEEGDELFEGAPKRETSHAITASNFLRNASLQS